MLFKQFEKLERDVVKLNAPESVQVAALAALKYLRTESLTHSGREGKIQDRHAAWLKVSIAFEKYDPKGEFKNSPGFYELIHRFVGIGASQALPDSFGEAAVRDAFKKMHKRAGVAKDPLEVISMRECLTYLIEQQRWIKAGRNQKQIQAVWRKVQPLLRKHRILDEFDHEPIKSRMIDYIRGNGKLLPMNRIGKRNDNPK